MIQPANSVTAATFDDVGPVPIIVVSGDWRRNSGKRTSTMGRGNSDWQEIWAERVVQPANLLLD
jgi:hypothetical protein